MIKIMGRKVEQKSVITAISCLIVILITCIFCICYLALSKKKADDMINISVELYYADASTQEFKISTAKTTLEQALIDEGLISSGTEVDGVYSTFDDVTAENGAVWEILVDGEETDLKISDIGISNGDRYQIIYTNNKEKE